jgi:hypothetical protein
MHTNRLASEKSPYLLQHAHNPVDWYPWGEEAFDKARHEEKPIFLSIGYSTCHWCHVMERESFEKDEVAAILNQDFVSIKVDREERPDVDRIYMTFVQATTGGGGWPMSVWLTPNLRPFYGGTYFAPDSRYGRPGFTDVLQQIAQAWRTDRDRIIESGENVVAQLRKAVDVAPSHPGSVLGLDEKTLESAFFAFRRSFDSRDGGFNTAPKFPRPVNHNFLLRYWARTRQPEALEMVLKTLREMAKGGMNDHLGGGFHRYSVDGQWFLSHFEKMLYDQAQLAVSYVEAFQITKELEFAARARSVFEYVLRDMTDAEGGFYSAEDADSVIDPAFPNRKGEGAFYVWKQSEINAIAGDPVAHWFCYRYGVAEHGNVSNDPHEEFADKNILYEAHTVEETAAHFSEPVEAVGKALLEVERSLLAVRSTRVRPHLDDKILTSWNGLMISALAKGGAALAERRYIEAAIRAADFVLARMYDSSTGTLLRRYRQGDAAISGFLDDYASFTQALLDIYEASFELKYLQLAIKLTEKQRDLFEDKEHGAFYSTAAGESELVLRIKEDYDGAEPSGNSMAVLNLLRLAEITHSEDFRKSAERALAAFAPRMMAAAMGVPQMLVALEFSLSKPKQIILAGERSASATLQLRRVVDTLFVPNKVVVLIEGNESQAMLSAYQPIIAGMEACKDRATAYVCENYTCQLPVSDPEKLAGLLQ